MVDRRFGRTLLPRSAFDVLLCPGPAPTFGLHCGVARVEFLFHVAQPSENQTKPPRGDVSVRVVVCGVPPRTVLLGNGDGRQKGHRGRHWGVWSIDRHGKPSARCFVGVVCVYLDPHHHGPVSHGGPSREKCGELGNVCSDVLFFNHVSGRGIGVVGWW